MKATGFGKKKKALRNSNQKRNKATDNNKPQVPPQPQKVDKADITSYQISSVVKDRRNRITHVRIGNNLYDMPTLYQLHKESDYRFYTTDDNVIKRDVLLINRKGGKYYFATEADWKKENNLDYLPQAKLD